MRLRRIDYEGGAFTYGNRIAVAHICQDTTISEYAKMKACWHELYGWNARLLPLPWRVRELERMMRGLAHWAEVEQQTLKYEPTPEELRAGIKDYSDAVGDMGTIKAMAKAYAQDPDTVLGWSWGKVYGILLTDLEEYRFGERLRKQYEKRK